MNIVFGVHIGMLNFTCLLRVIRVQLQSRMYLLNKTAISQALDM